MHSPKAKIRVIALGGGQIFFHFIVRPVLLQVIYLRQPGRFEHNGAQATLCSSKQISTANKHKLGITRLECLTHFDHRPTSERRLCLGNQTTGKLTGTATDSTTALVAQHATQPTTTRQARPNTQYRLTLRHRRRQGSLHHQQ